MMIELTFQDWAAMLAPAMGGSIVGLRWRDQNILRPGGEGADEVLSAGCFPLLPYANRIAAGRFIWQGEMHQLRLNYGDPRWSLHGLGWQRAWEVADHGIEAARLTLDHAPDADWPWPFHAEQSFVLAETGLVATLILTNHADADVPVGLGFHPYFVRRPGTRLRTKVSGAWGADDAVMPTQRLPAAAFGNWAGGDAVERPALVDNAFDGWAGHAGILSPGIRITLDAEEADFFHLYLPPGEDFFCAEPVTQLPDAINRPDMPPMSVLKPGQTARLTMRIGAEPA